MPVFACHRVVLAWWCVALLGAQGCSVIPAHEYAEFAPLPKAQRPIEQVKISWEVRDDASDYCKQRQLTKGCQLKASMWRVRFGRCSAKSAAL